MIDGSRYLLCIDTTYNSLVKNDSAKVELVINFKHKAHFMATVRVAADIHLIGAEVAMPRIDWVGVQRGDQKKSINRQSSQRRRKDQSNY